LGPLQQKHSTIANIKSKNTFDLFKHVISLFGPICINAKSKRFLHRSFIDFRFGLFMRPKKIKGSAQDNSGRILAIDLTPGLNLWKLEIRRNGQNQHGITYDNGVIFAGTGKNTTLLALNPTDGKVIWQTIPAGDPNKNYITQGPPTVWKNIALIGHATSSGPINPDLKGKVTAFNRTNGEKLWSSTNTVGPPIQHENANKNGGAPIWTG